MDGSGVANLFLAGDWVRTSINGGSVEAAFEAGQRAADVRRLAWPGRRLLGLVGQPGRQLVGGVQRGERDAVVAEVAERGLRLGRVVPDAGLGEHTGHQLPPRLPAGRREVGGQRQILLTHEFTCSSCERSSPYSCAEW